MAEEPPVSMWMPEWTLWSSRLSSRARPRIGAPSLPDWKVKEKARKLKRSFSDEMLTSTTSSNILAMTFRQVVLQHLWSFQLIVFGPGTWRNMDDLESPREVTTSFALSSSNERVISVLAEALCLSALERTKENFLDSSFGRSSNFFGWSRRPKKVYSRDSSVVIYMLSEDEIVENAKTLVESFKSAKQTVKQINSRGKNMGWTASAQTKLEKIGGPEFCAWLNEYVPVYRLQIDSERLEDLKLEGWKQLLENRWEVVLSHSQMVGLTNILDMFYEDAYTLPAKELGCNIVVNPSSLSNSKRGSSLVQMLTIALAGGILAIAIRTFSQSYLPHVQKLIKCLQEHRSLPPSSETAN
ncbi:uncharacterized protein LOC116208430 isoform X2 [Punica granatum]|uniref:Uncharacterized protein LOC116208430 isoform X2 n=1 Tax=Punica granatum TaxID=22663 RepID=A0A6P8DNU9_PUNGR|nr:uncharacterized protein LOC116208430 isoform X2 [Punica granatum]